MHYIFVVKWFLESIRLRHIFLTGFSFSFTVAKAAAAAVPVAALSAPAFALDSIVSSMPTNSVALEVQFGAYMAVALGTLLPCLFLINLFIQTESRKAGREGGIDAE